MKFSLKVTAQITEKVKKMTARQLLQTISCPAAVADAAGKEEFPVLFLHGTTFEKAKAFTSARDALVCTDTECGPGMMLAGCANFPSMAALGVCDDPEIAYQVGRITAKDSVNAGFRWSLSPCVDIRFNDRSPAVSIRSAGDNAETVIRIAGAYMEGLQDGGVAATLKHFPGEGLSDYDQHLTTTVNTLSKEAWLASYGKVYRELIERGAMCVMPGHIALPAFDEKDPVMDLYPPATLSKPLLTDLLKGELGFEGLVCSDALSMSGFSGFMNYYEACAKFLECGGDVLLFARTNDVFYEKMEKLVSRELLEDRAARVLSFVKTCKEMPVTPVELPEDRACSRLVTEKAVTVQRDRFGYLPIQNAKEKNFLVVDLSSEYTGAADGKAFYNTLQQAGYQAEFLENPGTSALRKAAESGAYDAIFPVVANGFSFGTNVLQLHGRVARNMMEGWTKLGTPVVFICTRDLSFHNQFAAPADAVIYTHGVTEFTHNAVIKKIFA